MVPSAGYDQLNTRGCPLTTKIDRKKIPRWTVDRFNRIGKIFLKFLESLSDKSLRHKVQICFSVNEPANEQQNCMACEAACFGKFKHYPDMGRYPSR